MTTTPERDGAGTTLPAPTPASGYVNVDGLPLYYERHGDGPPLLLLHGAFGTIESCFARLLPVLAQHFEVIAVELQGHGRTPDIARPLTYDTMAADAAAVLERLGVERAHAVGYSMGGAVALLMALDRPDLVDRLVWFGGVSFDPAGLDPELTASFESFDPHQLDGTMWHDAYRRVAPDPDAWIELVDKVNALDRAGFAISTERLVALPAPTLLMIGDRDIVRPEHVLDMSRLIGRDAAATADHRSATQLAVLPGTDHVGVLERVDWVSSMITTFLEPAQR